LFALRMRTLLLIQGRKKMYTLKLIPNEVLSTPPIVQYYSRSKFTPENEPATHNVMDDIQAETRCFYNTRRQAHMHEANHVMATFILDPVPCAIQY
jgi:hypothetical protein